MSQEHIVPRTGQPPLRFTGELILEHSGSLYGGKDQNRYHEAYLYRTDSGRTVLHVAYVTHWGGEEPHYSAWVWDGHPTDAEVLDALQGYDPTEHVRGFPPGKHYEAKQERLMSDIKRRWDSLLSSFLLEGEFCEDI